MPPAARGRASARSRRGSGRSPRPRSVISGAARVGPDGLDAAPADDAQAGIQRRAEQRVLGVREGRAEHQGRRGAGRDAPADEVARRSRSANIGSASRDLGREDAAAPATRAAGRRRRLVGGEVCGKCTWVSTKPGSRHAPVRTTRRRRGMPAARPRAGDTRCGRKRRRRARRPVPRRARPPRPSSDGLPRRCGGGDPGRSSRCLLWAGQVGASRVPHVSVRCREACRVFECGIAAA